ncbi:DNA-binding transcriptional regulator, MocR family, contains an aminotransferase domain [Parapedobacter composti]|uniref:DNA-binding transcriptional regulator, MocR family, contains an aminotransferase domain n=1 Tax=Parapedobacter composti TaxID=623281 RepID=A0A1I1LPD3_9SPHI|nr:PLP-dependent aminotransferase family protein [Parapedobacter composti]SFC74412.1 DNA-binding transcriptional regulator, MocR family, contains an aminotransferase domain [Parapedobacter composti]
MEKVKEKPDFAYMRIAKVMEQQILNGTLRTGDKLPSLRTICREYGVSQNTALTAYYNLESKFLIETRPQSGYYVRYSKTKIPSLPQITNPGANAEYTDSESMIRKVYDSLGEDGHLPLALGSPANELLPIAKLNKGLVTATRELKGSGVAYDKTEGNERLRRQIARWSFAMECDLNPDEIITTSGCLNAVSLCLMALTEKGDTIAMESPISFGMLQLAQTLGLKVLELPSDPRSGVDLNALADALKKRKIKACLFISNFSNPLGSCMPDENKRQAVGLLAKYDIPLIENDLNGDVYFSQKRPKSCKTYDESGLVLWCGSVSKTLAPGYRVGWVAPGKFKEEVRRIKRYHNISSTSITQEVIAGFLETGRYERHLRKLRHTLHGNLLKFSRAIADHFPEGTMASRPQGGFVIWVELPGPIDTYDLYEKCLRYKIGFAPGRIFTLQNQYKNCLRLNYGLLWNEKLEQDLKLLGGLARRALK